MTSSIACCLITALRNFETTFRNVAKGHQQWHSSTECI